MYLYCASIAVTEEVRLTGGGRRVIDDINSLKSCAI